MTAEELAAAYEALDDEERRRVEDFVELALDRSARRRNRTTQSPDSL